MQRIIKYWSFVLLCISCSAPKHIDIGSVAKIPINAKDNFIDTVKPNKTIVIKPIIKKIDTVNYYESAFAEINNMVSNKQPLSFKRAVFVTENAYLSGKLHYATFDTKIKSLAWLCNQWIKANKIPEYKEKDSLIVLKNFAIFKLMKDTIRIMPNNQIIHLPYTYDFDDFAGQKDWTKMFVTKLFNTGSGNCHSLPYLYKILADELQIEAYLSFAPNHLYIKNPCKQSGWYNTELTSGEFPTDAWVKTSGYVSLDAIRSGIYMDTVGKVQSVAFCAFDLAQCYLKQTNNYSDGFVLKCCDLVLKYFPNSINTLLLKGEALNNLYDIAQKNNQTQNAFTLKNQMEKTYMQALQYGYRYMPKEMYEAWITSINQQKDKYINKEILNFNNKIGK